jgi:hypothetical protein
VPPGTAPHLRHMTVLCIITSIADSLISGCPHYMNPSVGQSCRPNQPLSMRTPPNIQPVVVMGCVRVTWSLRPILLLRMHLDHYKYGKQTKLLNIWDLPSESLIPGHLHPWCPLHVLQTHCPVKYFPHNRVIHNLLNPILAIFSFVRAYWNTNEHAHGNILNLWYINVTRGTDRESRNKINV